MELTEPPVGEHAPERVHAVVELPRASKNEFGCLPEWDAFLLDRTEAQRGRIFRAVIL